MRAPIEKECDPINWRGNFGEKLDKAGVNEVLNFDEIIMSEEEISLRHELLAMSAMSPLPEETVTTFPNAVTYQGNVNAPQDPPSAPTLASRLMSRLKAQKAGKGEVHNGSQEAVFYTPRELLEFSNSHKHRQAWGSSIQENFKAV